MTNKKIVLLTSYSPSIVLFRGRLIHSLVNLGCSVTVLAPNLTEDIISQVNSLGASVVEIGLSRTNNNLFYDFFIFCRLYIYFVRFSPDVVLTYFLKPNVLGIISAFFARIPRRICMVEGLGYYFTPSSSGRRSFKKIVISQIILFLYRLVFHLSHAVITLNSDDKYLLVKCSGLSDSKSLPLRGIGICLDEWSFQSPFTSPLTFTFVGRLLFDKGIVEFLEAAAIVKSKFPFVRFILLGDFDDNPSSIDLDYLQPYLDNNIVEWFGFVSPLSSYRQTSVFVLPSYREGCPRSTQEAMSCGLPVITTNVPGCRETVIDGLNGFVVKPHSADSLVFAMCHFIKNPSLVSSMGLASRSLALSWFDVNLVNHKIISSLLS